MEAVVTPSHAVFSTNPLDGPVLHFQRIPPSRNEANSGVFDAHHSIELGKQDSTFRKMFVIREFYVAVIIGKQGEASAATLVVYHIPTRREMLRTTIHFGPLSIDSFGGTLAANVSNLGFVITGEPARDVANLTLDEDSALLSSRSEKASKGKMERLSLFSGQKKRFARRMSSKN